MKRILLLTISMMLTGAFVVSPARAETWQELLARADSLRKATKTDSALVVAKQALENVELTNGKEDTTTATVVELIGEILEDQAHYDEAEIYHRRSLSIFEKALGPVHKSVGSSLNNIAG